ncbi:MAG: LamG-like jellyroll fold domain-containing protein [Patescibacteria group bacterium]
MKTFKHFSFWSTFVFVGIFSLCGIFYSPSVARADITTGLVGYWDLDDGSGTSAEDLTGNGYTGTTVGGPAWITGKFGQALYLDGANTLGQSVGIPSISNSNTYSVSLWVKHDAVNGDASDQTIFILGVCVLLWDGGGPQRLRSYGLGTYPDSEMNYSWDAPASSATWNHIVVTSDESGNISHFYFNGVDVDQAIYQGCNTYGSTGSFTVGQHVDYATERDWAGGVDEVRLYSRALTSSDVTELYNYTLSAPTVTTSLTVDSIGQTSATLNANITATGGVDVTQHGFAYGTSATLSSVIATTTGGGFVATGAVTSSSARNISSLTCGTTYYFRAYATNSSGTGYGSIRDFSTQACNTVPDAPTSVAAVSANAQASVSFTPPINDGGPSIDYYAVISSPGGITAYGASSPITVSGLTNDTQYSFTVVAHNSVGTSSPSSASNYVTPSASAYSLATLLILAPTSITETTLTLNSKISATGGEPAFRRGFQYGTSVTAYGATTTENGSFSTGIFSTSLSSLACGTRYHYRAYAVNSAGISYADQSDFVTSGCNEYFVATDGTAGGDGSIDDPWDLQTAFDGGDGDIDPGDVVWLRGGTYSPGSATTSAWNLSVSGTLLKPVQFRSYTGEWARIDKAWNFTGQYHYFRDFEMFDSIKGQHRNPGYPNGPWAHWREATRVPFDAELVNLVIHDISGAGCGSMTRGTLYWYTGLNALDHPCYPTRDKFIGNILAWNVSDALNLLVGDSVIKSNIIFGSGQTLRAKGGRDFLMSGNGSDLTISGNYFYNYFANRDDDTGSGAITVAGIDDFIFTDNIVAAPVPLKFTGYPNYSFIQRNTIHMTSHHYVYPVIHRMIEPITGIWSLDNNYYSSGPGQFVRFEEDHDDGINPSYTFSQWKLAKGYDANSTSVDSAYPPDSVNVVINHDEPKRAHVAVYNWTQASSVTADISNVLSPGDTYSVYSVQDFLAGPVASGVVSGSTISIPMTGLTVAPILYGADWIDNPYPNPQLVEPAITSPEFAAFIIIGGDPVVSSPTLTTGDATSITETVATLAGTITATGNANPTVRGFAYGLTTGYGSIISESGNFSTGTYSFSLSALTCNTIYHYVAYATNSGGTSYGSDDTFTTPTCSAGETPVPTPTPLITGGGNIRNRTTVPVATTTLTLSPLTPCITRVYPAFTQNLSMNLASRGTDVLLLQKLLALEGFVVFTPLPIYESTTQTAVQSLQTKYGIVTSGTPVTTGYGNLGPTTRSFVNQRLSQGAYSSLGTCATQTPPPTPSTFTFQRNLTLDSTGPDVKALQIYLNTHGFPVATSGVGSPGNETTYFGYATRAALIKFQLSKGIVPASGFFGPITRANVK